MFMLKQDFPILQDDMSGKPLVYLDNAATTQKPQAVIDAVVNYYTHQNANIYRGIYKLSENTTQAFEMVRAKVAKFINAGAAEEIIFVRGTTEAINLIAQSFGRTNFVEGDEVIISSMEHHANIVPWHILGEQIGIKLRVVEINDAGEVDLARYRSLFNPRTKLVSVTHVSNVLGTINPVKEMVHFSHSENVPVLLDGAQAVPHMSVDVRDLDCDFYTFSAHKMYGPTGIGVLYGKRKWLDNMPPYQGGGEMVRTVSFDKTTFADLPHKFEAGTVNIAGVIGLGAAIDYLNEVGMSTIEQHANDMLEYATARLKQIPQLKIIGEARYKTAIISFVLDKIHAHDIGTVLSHEGIAIRAGHHCAMPLMQRFNVPATARVAFALYNDMLDVDKLVAGIKKVLEMFG